MATRRVLHDRYFKQAKEEGYLARSAYKLIEINRRKSVIKAGDLVLDLGCAPGSWVQVASRIVGPRGRVVGIDLLPVDSRVHELGPGVSTLVGDINATPAVTLREMLGGQPPPLFDVVLSDMAPNTSGFGDDLRSTELCRSVVRLLPDLLKAGGGFVIKIFEGEQYPRFLREVSRRFAEAKGFKPEASRDVSREMYIIAKGYRPEPGPAT